MELAAPLAAQQEAERVGVEEHQLEEAEAGTETAATAEETRN